MPKISEEKRERRRTEILKAARRCFLRDGLHVTTMAQIIKESGLSAGAVYRYFPSKEALIFAAVTTSLERLRGAILPLFGRDPLPSPDALLREIAEAIDSLSGQAGGDLKRLALLGWSEAQRNAELSKLMQGHYAGFRDLLAGAVPAWKRAGMLAPSARPGEVAKTLLACSMGYVAQGAIVGNLSPKELGHGLGQLTGKS